MLAPRPVVAFVLSRLEIKLVQDTCPENLELKAHLDLLRFRVGGAHIPFVQDVTVRAPPCGIPSISPGFLELFRSSPSLRNI